MTGDIFAEWKSLEHGENTVKTGQTRCLLVNLDPDSAKRFIFGQSGPPKRIEFRQFKPWPVKMDWIRSIWTLAENTILWVNKVSNSAFLGGVNLFGPA